MSPLAFSIVASIVLTVVLNLVLWMFPGAGRRLGEAVTRLVERSANQSDAEPGRVRFIFPWKAMLIGSIVLTIAINVLLVLLR
ncbi:MAG TPA: hypothetical protein VNC41_05575 [Acidimicrobiia bacterium]|nr:hypothetical protein [Acidimicrobiia bacterium]